MAQRALVDTTVLYAAANRSERRWHKTALEIVRGADRGELPVLVIPDVVLVETMNGVHRDVGAAQARDMLGRLRSSTNFHLVREPQAVWDGGLELFQAYDRLSLADAVQIAAARHHGIAYIYSFDSHFDGFDGLARLSGPQNPYAP